MNIIPNELKITINTNIPGFQNFKYKPSMTFPNDKSDNNIQFNPLIKLKSSVINSLPTDIQKKEFFNKGLFQSLINAHGLVREKSLVEATKEGYVDNNIKVTLDTLFPSNSILYINGQPYAIADVQWTKGDWKIDKKVEQLPQLESSKITDPYLYNIVVKDELISGENELQQLPKDVIYGSNFTGPQNVASGTSNLNPVPPAEPPATSTTDQGPTPTTNQGPTPSTDQGLTPTTDQGPTESQSQAKQQRNQGSTGTKPIKPTPKYLQIKGGPSQELQQKEKELQMREKKISQQQEDLLKQQQLIARQLTDKQEELTQQQKQLLLEQEEQISKQRKQLLSEEQLLNQRLVQIHKQFNIRPPLPPSLPNNSNNLQIKDEGNDDKVKEDENESDNNISDYEMKLKYSRKSSQTIREYFRNKDYYSMVNTIYKNMNENDKAVIDKFLRESSGVVVKTPAENLSTKAYTIINNNIQVNTNSGGGDCFFIAVADAINYHNLNVKTSADKIIYNNYGKGNMIFTQKFLRSIVADFILIKIEKDKLYLHDLLVTVQLNVDTLNSEFLKQYNDYREQNNLPITQEIFTKIINNIYNSVDSFLVKKPIKMSKEPLKPPFSAYKDKTEIKNYMESSDHWANQLAIDALCEILGLNIIVVEHFDNKLRTPYIYNNDKHWSKYMFLYHDNVHYELISFKRISRIPNIFRSGYKNNIEYIVIFDKIGYIFPPLTMIFLIFATNYINIKDQTNRENYKLLPYILKLLYNIFEKIKKNSQDEVNSKFLKVFQNYFNSSKMLTENKNNSDNSDNSDNIVTTTNPLRREQTNNNNDNNDNIVKPDDVEVDFKGGNGQKTQQLPYVSSYDKNNSSFENNNNNTKSNISYYITIDMALQKGSSLTPEILSNLKCLNKWGAVRKSYAELRGLKYLTLPDYNNNNNFPSKNIENNKKDIKDIITPKTVKGGLGLNRQKSKNKTRKRK